MAKTGDTVRYLNAVGGGVITRIEGAMAYVDDNGFETPVLLKELVVVMPAGHEPEVKGARLMFDQSAFDAGRRNDTPAPAKDITPAPKAAPVVETRHGSVLNITLAFEPADVRRLSETSFNAVLVNDSNYRLTFTFARRSAEEREWTTVYHGDVDPNELIDLAQFTHASLTQIENVALQCVAWRPDRPFALKAPVNARRRLDLKKFYKLHCFRPGLYFDTPVLEFPLVADDKAVGEPEIDPAKLAKALGAAPVDKGGAEELARKYSKDMGRTGTRKKNPADNPNKLLPLMEIDLHIDELTDTTAGMTPADMLGMQLDKVREVMKANSRRIGQKIVFIHGKGDGVLRKEVLKLLRRDWPKAELQDASFQEYGFGATLVTIH